LFSIEIKKHRNKRRTYKRQSETSPNEVADIDKIIPVSPQTKVTIAVTAGISNFKRIDLPQHTYYFSNTSLISNSYSSYGYNNEFKQYDGNKEVKIYSLDKRSNEDRKMIIQLHSCSGKFDFKLSKKIVDYDNNPNDIPITNNTDEYGRNKYLIDNLRDMNLYLSIKSAQLAQDCNSGNEKDSNNVECSKELSYLVYYYSLTDREYSTKKQDLSLRYRYIYGKDSQINIIVTPLGGKDRFNNQREQKDIEYNLFWTKNSTLKERLDNICYLSQIMNNNEEKLINETSINSDINIIRNIELNDKNEYALENLNSEETIYVNILARNLRTNELIAYIPLSGLTNKRKSAFKKIFISILLLCLLGIVGYVSFNYYKEVILKDYEDVRRAPVGTELSSITSKQGGYQRISL
jgi:hypothetical protein